MQDCGSSSKMEVENTVPGSADNRGDNIKVVVRCRPSSSDEVKAGYPTIVAINSVQRTITVKDPSSAASKVYTFDHAFGSDSTQPDIFNQVARPIIDNVLEGYNGTIFAYGQTGSGKTFTMEGVADKPELRGIIPNSFVHIFGHISKAQDNTRFLVRVSYFEIYKEQIRDLLAKKSDRDRAGNANVLEIKEDKLKGVYVKDLSEQVVHSADDLDRIMSVGKKNRVTAATKMNLHSSRSHAIFTVILEKSERRADGSVHICVGKLNLVDLAGSERQAKTEASDDRLKEAAKINHGLSNLGNVIAALTDGKSTHVPYRNSKLTRILQDSLGGNSKTVMCANVGPAGYNYDETVNTLRYATRAKSIKNAAKINEDPKDALLRKLEDEIQELRRQLSEHPTGGDGGGPANKRLTEEMLLRKRQREEEKSKLKKMRDELAAERDELERNRTLGEKERQKLQQDIAAKQEQLTAADAERHALTEKLSLLEKTIVVGGENLLDKAEEQQRLLEASAKELELRRKSEEELRKTLQSKKSERSKMEQKYQTLQEIATSKQFEVTRLEEEIQSLRADLDDLRQENKERLEAAQQSKAEVEKNIRLYEKVIDQLMPKKMQELIESKCTYNTDIGEWEVSCLAFTGAMMNPDGKNSHQLRSLNYAEALAQAEQLKSQHSTDRNWENLFPKLS